MVQPPRCPPGAAPGGAAVPARALPARSPLPEVPEPVARRGTRALALAAALLAAAGCTRAVELHHGDGLLRAQGREHRWSGLEQGPWRWWYPNGEPREQGAFDDGQRTGLWTQWYSNGQLRSRGQRRWDQAQRASLREGPWTFWHANGVRAAQGRYAAGRRTGFWEFTLDDGGLDGDRSGVYHDDQRID